MLKQLKNIFVITLPTLLVLFILLEVIFRTVIHASDIPDVFFDNEYRMLKFNQKTSHTGYATFGKWGQHRFEWTINKEGWNSPVDYVKEKHDKKRIAVIGDSYVEGFTVNNTDIYSNVLQAKLGNEYEVYSFGMSGAPLSQYLHMARYAAKVFDPDIFIINVVHNDFDESLTEVKNAAYFLTLSIDETTGKVEEKVPPQNAYQVSPVRRFFKKSAVIRYFIYNQSVSALLENLKNQDGQQTFNANIEVTKTAKKVGKVKIAVDYILNALQKEYPEQRILLVMDAPRNDIYKNALASSNVLFMEDILKLSCDAHEIEFLSLTKVMQRDFEQNKKEFNADYDYHWNRYGHDILANSLFSMFF